MKDNKSGVLIRGVGRALSLLAVTLLSLALILLGIIWVLEKGPSPTLTAAFCSSVRETSALRWMSRIFLSDEELGAYIQESTSELDTEPVNTSESALHRRSHQEEQVHHKQNQRQPDQLHQQNKNILRRQNYQSPASAY